MEVERALADLAEVRDRLASVQEFRGYSGSAAVLSGLIAVIAGVIQWAVAPAPQSPDAIHRYLEIWFVCLGLALAINYGALLIWYVRIAGRHERRQTRTVGVAIIPAIALGAVLSLAMLAHGMAWLLPGVWYASYGIGLFSSRAMLPRGVIFVTSGFGLAGAALILTLDTTLPLRFWVMPLGFGFGQMFIGYLLSQDRKSEIAL
ncbi:MAG TPA: hypothetical protein VGQ96_02355 [Candidatus Eremiobacteraceae bacterium]|nr:hypothetical protein [Candidatus Eremiobacteraceae bacterium]